MKKIGKIIITALLLIICVGAFGSLVTTLDKSNIGGGSNDGGFVDTTETNLYVGLKKSNGSFTENPFISAEYGGFESDDPASSTYIGEISNDYLNMYHEYDVDCYQLANDVHNEFYGSDVDDDTSTIDTSISVFIGNLSIPLNNTELEFYGLEKIILHDDKDNSFEVNLNGSLVSYSSKMLYNNGLNGTTINAILFVYGDYNYETSHDAYIRAVPLTYNSMYINIIENNVSVFENTFRADNYYFDENDKYEGYALMDLSILTDKYCNNKSFYNWNKVDGNYILIRTLDGSTNIVSNSYELDKQGLYLFGLPTSHNGTISVNWSADYEQD